MPDAIPLLASEIGSKLVVDDEHLRSAFFDPGSPMERDPYDEIASAIHGALAIDRPTCPAAALRRFC